MRLSVALVFAVAATIVTCHRDEPQIRIYEIRKPRNRNQDFDLDYYDLNFDNRKETPNIAIVNIEDPVIKQLLSKIKIKTRSRYDDDDDMGQFVDLTRNQPDLLLPQGSSLNSVLKKKNKLSSDRKRSQRYLFQDK